MNFFDTIKRVKEIESCLVFSNQKSFGDLASNAGLSRVLIDVSEDASELFPFGTLSSTDYIASTLNLAIRDIMVLDFRYPFVSSSSMRRAAHMYRESPDRVLISVKPSVDHPCQLESYFRILDVSLVHLLDSEEIKRRYLKKLVKRFVESSKGVGEDCFVTRPFYFDWPARGAKGHENGIYVRTCDHTGVRYLPCDRLLNTKEKTCGRSFWIKDNDVQARVLHFFNNHNEIDKVRVFSRVGECTIAGTGFVDNYSALSWLLYADHSRKKCCLVLDGDVDGPSPMILHVLPVQDSNRIAALRVRVGPDRLPKGIWLDLDWTGIDGLICSLTCVAEDGSHDFWKAFPSREDLWTGAVRKVNVKTGKEITGRQDFPVVFERDGAILIAPLDAFTSFKGGVSQDNFQGFESKEADSIRVDSELDLLRYKALCRAKSWPDKDSTKEVEVSGA